MLLLGILYRYRYDTLMLLLLILNEYIIYILIHGIFTLPNLLYLISINKDIIIILLITM